MSAQSRKIQFKVSSRTARLIGRENVANADGAIIELLKNSHDADAGRSFIYFSRGGDILIIDNGHGMTDTVIEQLWMTIGTDNKALNPISDKKRVKSGAKGIGRFALDRLGDRTDMYTKTQDNNGVTHWSVDWRDFEKNGQTVDNVGADITVIADKSLGDIAKSLSGEDFSHFFADNSGTILHVQMPRDIWDEQALDALYENLEALAVPLADDEFRLNMRVEASPQKYGEVKPFIEDEYDMKLRARYDADKQTVSGRIYRNELDSAQIEADLKDVFEQDGMGKKPYTLQDFKRGYFDWTYSVKELLPGYTDKDNRLTNIGSFDFDIVFAKQGESGDDEDAKKYPYKFVDYAKRKAWFKKFGGVKIFRDNFRVRPYGEKGNDWLDLGKRNAASPQGAGQRLGGYRVRPRQVAGSVRISRMSNIFFDDKSSREGIQENETFETFKNLLLAITGLLEKDRNITFVAFSQLYDDTHETEKNKAKGREIAARVRKNKDSNNKHQEYSQEDAERMAETIDALDQDLLIVNDHLSVLRSLASAGLITAAAAHELRQLERHIKRRASSLRELIEPHVSQADAAKRGEAYDPYVLIDDLEKDDASILEWLYYALMPLQRDKRKRKTMYLQEYFESLKSTWQHFFEDRSISLEYSLKGDSTDKQVKMFPIDLDTVFNNLVVNSIESFNRQKERVERKISIVCTTKGDSHQIIYEDNGSGLDKAFHSNPSEIFYSQVTSKRDEKGNEVGTGMGMYLVKSVIDENGGSVRITKIDKGFGVSIILPKVGARGE